jgi:hypothetical protein
MVAMDPVVALLTMVWTTTRTGEMKAAGRRI